MRQEIGDRLLSLMGYFGQRDDALPEWREAARIQNVDDLWKFWPHMPCVSKQDLQTHFEPNAMRRRFGLKGRISSTGGSTGEPTAFLHDPEMLLATTAANYFGRLRCGWSPGLATICLWGSERDIGRSRTLRNRISGFLRNDWLVDGYSLGQHTTDKVLALMRRHGQVAIYGFTSMLEFLAQEVISRNALDAAGRVKTAWNGGEMLLPDQSELFHRAFGVPILNCYGGRELSTMACQCSPETSLNVLRPLVFVEILDDAGRPVPPGESGRLVWTSTVCRGTPFIRYDIGDMGCSTVQDQDGAGVRAISQLQGRCAELFKLPNGRTIHSLFWNHLFKDLAEVKQFQVVMTRDQKVLLKLRGNPWTDVREAYIRNILQHALGPVPVGVEWVERIPLTAQGKLIQVIHQA